MNEKYIQTAESVTEGHPDKLCDTIADRVLDACLERDPAARVACEVMATAGKIIVAGEITAAELPDIPAIVCRTVRAAGYGGSDYEVEVELAGLFWTVFSGLSKIAPLFLCIVIVEFHLIWCPILELLMRSGVIKKVDILPNRCPQF